MKTKFITWNETKGFTKEDELLIKTTIANGGLVAFPTETVYGLGGDGLNKDASGKIYAAKGRPSDNPLILHISDFDMLKDIVDMEKTGDSARTSCDKDTGDSAGCQYDSELENDVKKITKKFWPGPLTIILNKKENVPFTTTGGLDTVAVRMPKHRCALNFISIAQTPIAAPSANLSGKPSPVNANHVKQDMDGRIDIIIDGGDVGIGYESTILDMTVKPYAILRPGFIKAKDIEKCIGKEVLAEEKLSHGSEEKSPKAPGMKYKHYSPEAQVYVYMGNVDEQVTHIIRDYEKMIMSGKYNRDEIGIMATKETIGQYIEAGLKVNEGSQGCDGNCLTSGGKVLICGSRKEDDVGKYLYYNLRKFDELGVKVVLGESFGELSDGHAIMNRLKKAAAGKLIFD